MLISLKKIIANRNNNIKVEINIINLLKLIFLSKNT